MLVTNLPGTHKTLRMRIWRALKSSGAGTVRDGVYVLPDSASALTVFNERAAEIQAGGGSTQIFTLQAGSAEQQQTMLRMFDRTEDYAQVMRRLKVLRSAFAGATEAQARQQLAAVTRDAGSIAARDFFPGEAHKQIRGSLADAESALNALFAPDEPRPAHRRIQARALKDYRGRTWATRQHLWADRVASAWLIRRFIDSKAKFVWLRRPKDCPKRAVGFDFDGAEFSHVDSLVTFEVLTASFALEQDPGIARLGALVHHLDVGGIPVAEGPGFATILAGARSLQADDDALLLAMTPVLDCLYAGFSQMSLKE